MSFRDDIKNLGDGLGFSSPIFDDLPSQDLNRIYHIISEDNFILEALCDRFQINAYAQDMAGDFLRDTGFFLTTDIYKSLCYIYYLSSKSFTFFENSVLQAIHKGWVKSNPTCEEGSELLPFEHLVDTVNFYDAYVYLEKTDEDTPVQTQVLMLSHLITIYEKDELIQLFNSGFYLSLIYKLYSEGYDTIDKIHQISNGMPKEWVKAIYLKES